MKASIITIGDEILIGQITDTNSPWIAKELNKLGVEVVFMNTVSDTAEAIEKAIDQSFEFGDLVIVTGGLGPTKDDVTKHVITKYFNDELVLHQGVLESIQNIFTKRNIPFSKLNHDQAMLPKKCEVMNNRVGTASGMWFSEKDKHLVSLPGVPFEMKVIMEEEVLLKIRKDFHLPFIKHITYSVYGVGESSLAGYLESFEDSLPEMIKMAYLPSPGCVRLRFSGIYQDKIALEDVLDKLGSELKSVLDQNGINISVAQSSVVENIKTVLSSQNKTLAVAESCTGGKISSEITRFPGVSSFFKGGIVAYDSSIKENLLKVDQKVIIEKSVVSNEVAKQMALGIQKLYNSDYAIATTGNAGPTTDDTSEDLGVVYIAIATPKSIVIEKFNFGQPREKVIEQAKNKAFELLYKEILKNQ